MNINCFCEYLCVCKYKASIHDCCIYPITRKCRSQSASFHNHQIKLHHSFIQCTPCVCTSLQVTIIGDGRCQTLTMAGDKLSNTDALVKVGEEVPMPAAIKDTRKVLSEKVFR